MQRTSLTPYPPCAIKGGSSTPGSLYGVAADAVAVGDRRVIIRTRADLGTIAERVGVGLSLGTVTASRREGAMNLSIRLQLGAETVCPACDGNGKQGRERCTVCKGTKYARKYQRLGFMDSKGRQRRVHAVCWHGHRDFFLTLFDSDPAAVVVSPFIPGGRYEDAHDFEYKYFRTGDRNIGSQVSPLAYRDACNCEE